ncbi:Zinc finger, RING-type [Corchorus olitorius]|uniref:RING-type E3 ubiquitin transferase n=1 Tax=Corchorus olitorius TaxID=93759 RepID=A0A1R3K022_9ROSI|nr:Zinc finger, RING-type [Corchorus olitorius]
MASVNMLHDEEEYERQDQIGFNTCLGNNAGQLEHDLGQTSDDFADNRLPVLLDFDCYIIDSSAKEITASFNQMRDKEEGQDQIRFNTCLENNAGQLEHDLDNRLPVLFNFDCEEDGDDPQLDTLQVRDESKRGIKRKSSDEDHARQLCGDSLAGYDLSLEDLVVSPDLDYEEDGEDSQIDTLQVRDESKRGIKRLSSEDHSRQICGDVHAGNRKNLNDIATSSDVGLFSASSVLSEDDSQLMTSDQFKQEEHKYFSHRPMWTLLHPLMGYSMDNIAGFYYTKAELEVERPLMDIKLRIEQSGLSEAIVESQLRTQEYCRYKGSIVETESLDDNPELCSICLVEYKNQDKIAQLYYCEHIFHADCIKKWLVRKNLCPICRS